MVNRLAVLLAAFCALPALSPADTSAERRRAEAARWTPSLALVSGITVLTQEAFILNTVQSDNPLDAARPSLKGSTTAVTPYFGGQLELMTPAVSRIPGRPRFFGSAEVIGTFGSQRENASEDDASEFVVPEDADPSNIPNGVVGGVGSRARSQLKPLTFAAFGGISFEFEHGERLYRIKPGVGWMNFSMDFVGLTRQTFKVDPLWPGDPLPYDPQFGEYLRFVSLQGATSEVYNAVGPGAEFEMEVGQWGPVRPSLFIMFYAFKVLGDQTVTLSDTRTYADPLGTATYTSVWTWELQPWMYRGGLGMRLRWMGKKR